MTTYILAFFTQNGSPATGLSATVDVYDMSGTTKIINAAEYTEIGGGGYKLDWSSGTTAYSATSDYFIVSDGGATLSGAERYKYGSNEADISNNGLEGSTTYEQAMRLMLSALAGKSTGGGTATLTFRDQADSKPRITATVDTDGNRDAMTLDGT